MDVTAAPPEMMLPEVQGAAGFVAAGSKPLRHRRSEQGPSQGTVASWLCKSKVRGAGSREVEVLVPSVHRMSKHMTKELQINMEKSILCWTLSRGVAFEQSFVANMCRQIQSLYPAKKRLLVWLYVTIVLHGHFSVSCLPFFPFPLIIWLSTWHYIIA
jgi:hypothetical protein